MSKHVINGDIKCALSSSVFDEPDKADNSDSSDFEFSDSEDESRQMDTDRLLKSITKLTPQELQKVNKSSMINLIAKTMTHGNDKMKEQVCKTFRTNLHKGQNFHYEVTNRYLMVALKQTLNFQFHENSNGLSRELLESLKQVMDFKMQNGTLDIKTYLSILETYLINTTKFSSQFGIHQNSNSSQTRKQLQLAPFTVLDHRYTDFLQSYLEGKSDVSMRDLSIIQKAVVQEKEHFRNSDKVFQITVQKGLEKIIEQSQGKATRD